MYTKGNINFQRNIRFTLISDDFIVNIVRLMVNYLLKLFLVQFFTTITNVASKHVILGSIVGDLLISIFINKADKGGHC